MQYDETLPADEIDEDEEGVRAQKVLIDLTSRPANFSDIHLECNRPVMVRMPTGWHEVTEYAPLGEVDIASLLKSIDPDWRANISYAAISRAIDLMSCRLRINAYTVGSGLSIAVNVRRQPLQPLTLEETALPMYLRTLLDQPAGLILFTGPTGAGKTTSMAAMLDYINKTRAAHIITIEDPIEYVHERKQAIFSQREVKVDTPTFAQGLRDALRQKPDVIMVGEIRDRDTAETVFLAAESGHLVLASLHTNSAKGSLNKMLSWFPEETASRARTLADTILCIVSQTRVPNPEGTDRVLATEVLMNQGDEVRDIIEQPERYAGIVDWMRAGRDRMSHTLNQSLARLIKDRRITPRDALRYTNDRMELHAMLNPSAPQQNANRP